MTLTIDRALIVKPPYAQWLVSGIKLWEMRGQRTKIRGWVGIIEQGTGLIIGEVFLADSVYYPERHKHLLRCRHGHNFHRVAPENWQHFDKWCHAWVVSDSRKYEKPVSYIHPPGAQSWVVLTDDNTHNPGPTDTEPTRRPRPRIVPWNNLELF